VTGSLFNRMQKSKDGSLGKSSWVVRSPISSSGFLSSYVSNLLRGHLGAPTTSGAPMKLIVLSGLAGVGKTEMLARLSQRGEPTLDLEALACHRGSAFGGLGLGPQPTHAAFQRDVRACLAHHRGRIIWVEDEGDFVGSVGLPAELVASMRHAPCIELRATRSARVAHLVAEYGRATESEWLSAIDAVAPRLGTARAESVRTAIAAQDRRRAVDILLDYYDGGYRRRASTMSRRRLGIVHQSASAVDDVLRLMTRDG
jgi:tRNA 2-selenouridine synthase